MKGLKAFCIGLAAVIAAGAGCFNAFAKTLQAPVIVDLDEPVAGYAPDLEWGVAESGAFTCLQPNDMSVWYESEDGENFTPFAGRISSEESSELPLFRSGCYYIFETRFEALDGFEWDENPGSEAASGTVTEIDGRVLLMRLSFGPLAEGEPENRIPLKVTVRGAENNEIIITKDSVMTIAEALVSGEEGTVRYSWVRCDSKGNPESDEPISTNPKAFLPAIGKAEAGIEFYYKVTAVDRRGEKYGDSCIFVYKLILEDLPPEPTAETSEPTATPTAGPTATPTAGPTATPTAGPTAENTAKPTETPTAENTAKPTAAPTAKPTEPPTEAPSETPAEATEDPENQQTPVAKPEEEGGTIFTPLVIILLSVGGVLLCGGGLFLGMFIAKKRNDIWRR